MTAACIASIASFVALPVTSPFASCWMRFLRVLSSFLSKLTLRMPVVLASDSRTTVRGSTSSVSVKIASRSRSMTSRSGAGSISGYTLRVNSSSTLSSSARRMPRRHNCPATRCLSFFTPANSDTQVCSCARFFAPATFCRHSSITASPKGVESVSLRNRFFFSRSTTARLRSSISAKTAPPMAYE